MKHFKILLSLFAFTLLTPTAVSAQALSDASKSKLKTKTSDPSKIFVAVEKQAKPVEGIKQFYLNFSNEFQAPTVDEGVAQIRVFLSFVVEIDGSFTDVKATRDPGYGAGQEAIRTLLTMPKWIPAEQDGKAVRSQFNLPITINVTNANVASTTAKNSTIANKLVSAKDFDYPSNVQVVVDKTAKPKNGLQNFYTDFANKFAKSINVPKDDSVLVFVSFVVEKDGSIQNIKVIKENGNYSDKVIEVLKSMPNWIPAEYKGQKVSSLYTLPIKINS